MTISQTLGSRPANGPRSRDRPGLQFVATPVVNVTDADGKVLENNAARTGRRVLADGVTSASTDVPGYGTGTAADNGLASVVPGGSEGPR